ncbi:hypothetical protein ACW2QC_14365 [Virgibacillus sp. FSP13]
MRAETSARAEKHRRESGKHRRESGKHRRESRNIVPSRETSA